MDANIVAGIMGLAGAIIGGACSYFGNVKGSTQNYQLNVKLQKSTAKKALSSQLSFTIKKIDVFMQNLEELKNDTDLIPYNLDSLIYDKEWNNYLSKIDDISYADRENIIVWFNWLNDIEWLKVSNGGLLTKAMANELLSKRSMDFEAIKRIIANLSQDS